MDESDRTSIHEVMEQQTVSIAKAGITTTLNARTSVLAAAYPVFGRYNQSKSAVENMRLPAALLSRFDLKFLLLDHPDKNQVLLLAKYVLELHKHGQKDGNKNKMSNNAHNLFDSKLLRAYIRHAKSFDPKVSRSVMEKMVTRYVEMRRLDAEEAADEKRGRKSLVNRE